MPHPPEDTRGGLWGKGTRLCFSRIFRRCGSLRAAAFLLAIWLCLITVINLGSSGQQRSLGLKDDAPLFLLAGGLTSFPTPLRLSPIDRKMGLPSNRKAEAKLALRKELKSSIKGSKSAVKALEDGQTSNLVKNGFISGRRIQEIKISQMGGLEVLSHGHDEGLGERRTRYNNTSSTFLSGERSHIDSRALMKTNPRIQILTTNLEDLQPSWTPDSTPHIFDIFFPGTPEHILPNTQDDSKQFWAISSRAKISLSKSMGGYTKTKPQDSEMTLGMTKYELHEDRKSRSGYSLQSIGERHDPESNIYDGSSEINTYFSDGEQKRVREEEARLDPDHLETISIEYGYHTTTDPLTDVDSVTNTETLRGPRSKSNPHRPHAIETTFLKHTTEHLHKNTFDQKIHPTNPGVIDPASSSVRYRRIEQSNRERTGPSFTHTQKPNIFYQRTLSGSELSAKVNELFPNSKEFVKEMNSDVTLQKVQLSQSLNSSNLSATLTSVIDVGHANLDISSNEKTLVNLKPAHNFKYDGFELYSYNVTASNTLPLNRNIPDTRPPRCQHIPAYASLDLPRSTVIICFHNEALSVLLRTVHSVLNRAPSHLLEKIILVDDYSTQDDLLAQLDEHLHSLNKVVLTRTSKREGLVGARILGSRLAASEVIVFLDAHCECNVGWLEPLLFSLSQNPQKVVSPYIDTIRSENFQYKQSPSQLRGGFTWRLEFGWRAATGGSGLLEETQPILTPVISGGLFAVRRDYFTSMGAYDPHLNIWGGENFELSFKTWMCGGSVEIVPCSRVGHVFRSSLPYTFTEGRETTVLRNLARVASVWMDSYADIFYAAVDLPNDLEIGDTSERTQLRKNLNCKSFKWYLDTVFPEIDIVSTDTVVYGQVRNRGSLMCIDVMNFGSGYYLGLSACDGGRNQTLHLTSGNQLKQSDACIVPGLNKQLTFSPCSATIKWIYEKDQLKLNGTNLCMTSVDNEIVQVLPCQDIYNTATTHISNSGKSSTFDTSSLDNNNLNEDNSWSSNSFQQWTFDYSFNWKRRRRRVA